MNRILFVPLVCLCLFAGCSEIFLVNAFRTFEDTSSTVTSVTTTDDIAGYSANPEFFESLRTDPNKKNTVIAILNESARSGTPAERQEASLLLADVYMKTDPDAGEIVGNVAIVLLGSAGGGSVSTTGSIPSTDPVELVKALLPDGLRPENAPPGSPEYQSAKQAFRNTLVSLAGAGAAYDNFGKALDPENDGTVAEPASDVNMGAIVQEAIICVTVSAVLETVVPGDAGGAADRLFDAMFGKGQTPEQIADFDFGAVEAESPGLSNIMKAAGLNDISSFGQGYGSTGGKS